MKFNKTYRVQMVKLLPVMLGVTILLRFGVVENGRQAVLDGEELSMYHQGIRQAVVGFPYVVGDCVGEDIPVPESAVELLRPNAILSRRYTNLVTGEIFDLLFVHCGDAQYMLGHHPPNCYPSQGWSVRRQADSIQVDGVYANYFASKQRNGQEFSMNIRQGLLLYKKPVTPNMDEALKLSSRRSTRTLGAGQIQVIVYGEDTLDSIEPKMTPLIRSLENSVLEYSGISETY